MAVTPQYQAVQVKSTYSGGYGSTAARTVSNVAAAVAKPAANYGYVSNASQAAYSTPQPAAASYTSTQVASAPNSGTSSSKYQMSAFICF